MHRSKRARESLGEGSSSVRALTDADIKAVVGAIEPHMKDKVADAVANKVADKVADKIADVVAKKVVDAVADKVADKVVDAVAEKVVHGIADVISDKAMSDERAQMIIVEPICAALADAVVSLKEAFPEMQGLADAVAVPVVAAVQAAAVPPPPVNAVLSWDKMTMEQIRSELNRVARWAVVRPIDNEVINRRLPQTAAANVDILTQLCPQARHGAGSNQYTLRGADRMTYSTMKTVKHRSSLEGTVPEIFRDWDVISASDNSFRHQAFFSHVKNSRNDGRSKFRRFLYKGVLYPAVNRHKANVDIKLKYPNAAMPMPAQAADSDYYAYTRSVVVCATGRLLRVGVDEPPQRTSVLTTDGCFIKDAEDALNEYARVSYSWSDNTLAAAGNTLREAATDLTFNWHALTPPDVVGTRINGPGAWRLLLPRLSTRADVDLEVQKMSEENMDLLDAGLDLQDVAKDAAVVIGVDDDEFDMGPAEE